MKYSLGFGSTVYIHSKVRIKKIYETSMKCMLVGYKPNGYTVWHKWFSNNSRDIIFDEVN